VVGPRRPTCQFTVPAFAASNLGGGAVVREMALLVWGNLVTEEKSLNQEGTFVGERYGIETRLSVATGGRK
jgi:hypothetical protein